MYIRVLGLGLMRYLCAYIYMYVLLYIYIYIYVYALPKPPASLPDVARKVVLFRTLGRRVSLRGLGFRVWGLGFKGLGLSVNGFFRAWRLGFRV